VAKRTFGPHGVGTENADTVERMASVEAELAQVLDSFWNVERSSATASLLSEAADVPASMLTNLLGPWTLGNGVVAIEKGAVVGTTHSTTRSQARTLFSMDVCMSGR